MAVLTYRYLLAGSIALVMALPAAASDAAPVKLVVKPLLCVIDKGAASCAMTFDIRWKSLLPAEYCLNDGATPPLRCWPRGDSGTLTQERLVSQDFSYWLAAPAGGDRAAEVKIEVLRVGSADRRRERRSRHVWDVL